MAVIGYFLLVPVVWTIRSDQDEDTMSTAAAFLKNNNNNKNSDAFLRSFSAATATVDPAPFSVAAKTFVLNTDFSMPNVKGMNYEQIRDRPKKQNMDYEDFLDELKEDSEDKMSIIAMGDKILLHQMLSNIKDVEQVPLLLAVRQYGIGSSKTYQPPDWEAKAMALFKKHHKQQTADLIMKPAGASSRAGLFLMDQKVASGMASEKFAKYMVHHMRESLGTDVSDMESEALQAVQRGVVVQERFSAPTIAQYLQSEGSIPLEVRVQTIWGKAFMGVFHSFGSDLNSCFITPSQVEGSVTWEAQFIPPMTFPDGLDMVTDGNKIGFNESTRSYLGGILVDNMKSIVPQAESIAAALGTPWLRVDFFILPESQKKPVVNEVAYGSDITYLDPKAHMNEKQYLDLDDSHNMVAAVLNLQSTTGSTSTRPVHR